MSSLAEDKKGVEYRWKGTRGPNGVKSGRGCLTPGEIYTFGGHTQFIQIDDGKFGERELAASQAYLECIQSATTPPYSPVIIASMEINHAHTKHRVRKLGGGEGSFPKGLTFQHHAVIQSTHFIVSRLSQSLCREIVVAARRFLDIVPVGPCVPSEGGKNQVEIPMPFMCLEKVASQCSHNLREAVLRLFTTLLNSPPKVNTLIFSETSGVVIDYNLGFVPSKKMAKAKNVDEVIATSRSDLNECYWCRAPAIGSVLKFCKGCVKVKYCSKDCQKLDWLAFHKKECKTLRKEGMTRSMYGIGNSRNEWLTKEGTEHAIIPVPFGMERSKGKGNGGIFEDAYLNMYLGRLDISPGGQIVCGKDTHIIPYTFALDIQAWKN